MKVALLTIDSREHFKDYDRPEPYFATAPEALLQGFCDLPEIEVHVISCLKERVPATHRVASNIFYHGLHVPGKWARTLYSAAVRRTREKICELNPDIVHGQGTERECALAAVRSGYPNVVTLHGIMRTLAKTMHAPMFSFSRLQAILEAWAVRRTFGVVCLTNHTRRQVEHLNRRTWIVPNAVNSSFLQLNRANAIRRDILCVARIDANKNQNLLIRALDPVAQANGLQLVFVGAGDANDPYFREFQELVKARPWCAYQGFQRGEELKARYQSARMVVLASLEENCPMAILEAMAVGVPVAAARSGGAPDLVDEGVTGLMFDAKNEASAREAILKIASDDALNHAMGVAAKQRAFNLHQPGHIARKHLELYEEALRTVS
jgi:glycosyltransferase involved in cell wall biosynthesis